MWVVVSPISRSILVYKVSIHDVVVPNYAVALYEIIPCSKLMERFELHLMHCHVIGILLIKLLNPEHLLAHLIPGVPKSTFNSKYCAGSQCKC